jgi:glycosyltransferase involved in cell wall biosynthesis
MTVAEGGCRIAFLIRSLGIGGAERQLAALATGLHRVGHEVTVLVYYGGGPFQWELEAAGVPVISLEKRGRWDLVGPFLRLARALRRNRPDIVHGYLPDANLLSLLAGRWVVKAKVVWGVRASHYDFAIYDVLSWILFWGSCRLAGRADLIVANSAAGRDYHVAHGYPPDRCVVVPNGIDTTRFRPDGSLRARQRDLWGVAENERLIGLVGRLDPMKDHPTFLQAASLIAKTFPSARFLCVGDGPAAYLAELQARAGRLGLTGRIRWVARAEDAVAAYNALDLLVSTSASGEGFSNVIAEAMACDVPCVVTDVGDSASIVGTTGLVIPSRNAAAVAAACGSILTRGRGDGAESPRARVVAAWTVDRLVTATAALLRSLCASSPRGCPG